MDIKFRFTCGESNLHEKTVNYKDIMSLIVDKKSKFKERFRFTTKTLHYTKF